MTKKALLIGLSVLIISLLAVSFASADEIVDQTPGVNFVDEDGDGLCDLCGVPAASPAANRIGYGQGAAFAGSEPGVALGPNFVDEDGDGVCDLYASGARAGGAGYGQGMTLAGTGLGPNFVDEDGDGVCDLLGTGAGSQAGRGTRGNRGAGGQGLGANLGAPQS